MELKYLLPLSFVTLVYIIIGGVIFHYIEGGNEEQARREAPEINLEWLRKLLIKNLSSI